MISEHRARAQWRTLFGGDARITDETFQEAEQLIDQLPPESPLRSRLSTELGEIRKLHEGP